MHAQHGNRNRGAMSRAGAFVPILISHTPRPRQIESSGQARIIYLTVSKAHIGAYAYHIYTVLNDDRNVLSASHDSLEIGLSPESRKYIIISSVTDKTRQVRCGLCPTI